jgi:hypothetical protein
LHRRIDKLTPEALSKDEVFVSALAQATQAAMRTHEPEKREALKNGIVHVAAPWHNVPFRVFGLIKVAPL